MKINENDKLEEKFESSNVANYNNLSFENTEFVINNQASENTNLLVHPLNINELLSKDESLNKKLLDKPTNITCIEVIERIIDDTGFNNHFIILFIGSGMMFMAEGSQIYLITVLNPIFKQIFDVKIYGEFLISLLSASFYLGYFLGCFLSPVLSKPFKRRNPIIISNILIILFSFLFISTENIYFMIINKLVIGSFFGVAIPLTLNNFSETIPSNDRETNISCLHAFYRLGIIIVIFFFNLITPEFNVDKWKYLYIINILPNIVALLIFIFFLKDSPKLHFHKKNIEATIEVLIYINQNFDRSVVDLTDEKIFEVRTLFYRENAFFEDEEDENKSMTASLASNNQFSKSEKFAERSNIIIEEAAKNFSIWKIFYKKYLLLTFLCLTCSMIIANINHTNMYYLPIALFNRDLKNKMDALGNLNHTGFNKTIANTIGLPNNTLSLITMFEEAQNSEKGYSGTFFVSQVFTFLAIFFGIFLSKNVGRKFAIINSLIPCILAGFVASIVNDMVLISSTIINFFIVIALISFKLYLVEAYNTYLRDSASSFSYMIMRFGDVFVPFITNILINYSLLAPMMYILFISILGLITTLFLPSSHDGAKIQ